jgi:hypothetical protein
MQIQILKLIVLRMPQTLNTSDSMMLMLPLQIFIYLNYLNYQCIFLLE